MSSSSAQVAYNPSDPVQQAFLSALALGETGNSSNAYSEGYGGVSLANVATDQYGFPTWAGSSTSAGPTNAAGAFQFQPSTWDSIASEYNLNFSSAADQNAGAWYEAEQTYAAKTGGSLESALSSNQYSSVQQALASIWPSVTGSGSAPQGLAADLASGTGANISSGTNASAASTSGASSTTGIVPTIENFFVRFGLIGLGGIIVVVALWQLLSNTTSVPSPGQTAKSAGRIFAAAA